MAVVSGRRQNSLKMSKIKHYLNLFTTQHTKYDSIKGNSSRQYCDKSPPPGFILKITTLNVQIPLTAGVQLFLAPGQGLKVKDATVSALWFMSLSQIDTFFIGYKPADTDISTSSQWACRTHMQWTNQAGRWTQRDNLTRDQHVKRQKVQGVIWVQPQFLELAAP